MEKNQLHEARRALLKAEIKRIGLTAVAELANKPPRQINDMAAGRKTFGDSIAKEIGPKIRPDLPIGWLVYPDEYGSTDGSQNVVTELRRSIHPAQQHPELSEFVLGLARRIEKLDIQGKIRILSTLLDIEQPENRDQQSAEIASLVNSFTLK